MRLFDSELVNAPGVRVLINAGLMRGLARRIEARQMESSDLQPAAPRVLAALSAALAATGIEPCPRKALKIAS
jgi:hypothetical protein